MSKEMKMIRMECKFCRKTVAYTRMAQHLRRCHTDKHDEILNQDIFGLCHTKNARRYFVMRVR